MTISKQQLEHIAKTCGNAIKTDNGWQCKCVNPDHRDKNSSLAISIGNNEELIAHCFACGSKSGTIETLWKMFPFCNPKATKNMNTNIKNGSMRGGSWKMSVLPGRKQINFKKQRYNEYENGTYKGKKIVWIPSPSKYNLKPADDFYLYISGDKSKKVCIFCEGEKAADSAKNIGAIGISGVCSASKIQSEESFVESFKLLNNVDIVYIFPDNDIPGYKHAILISKMLSSLLIKHEIKIWENSNEKSDLYDFVAEGKDLGDVINLKTVSKSDLENIISSKNSNERKKKQQKVQKNKDEAEYIYGPPLPINDRLKIEISPELFRDIDMSIKALSKMNVYQRNGRLVTVCKIPTENKDKKKSYELVIKEIVESQIYDCLSRCATYVKYDRDGNRKEIIPSKYIALGVLNRGHYREIPVIRGISKSPFLRKDGTICKTKGLDVESGIFLDYDEEYNILENPTLSDARKALNSLKDVFSDFPFKTKSGLYNVIAAILEIVGRELIGNAMANCFNAPTAGSGKTLLTDVISLIATGDLAAKATWPGGKSSEAMAELEKKVISVALKGSQIFQIDNVEGPIGGSVIEKIITSEGKISGRILGKNEEVTLPWRAVVMITGNGLNIRDDMRRRVLVTNLVPECERPELRTDFKYPNLLEHVKKKELRCYQQQLR